jgi:XapX domain-containing protein
LSQAITIPQFKANAKTIRRIPMKPMLISFAVGLFVGLLYGLIRVKSPAPPIIALLGLLGMVVGEQIGTWTISKRVDVAHAATTCLYGKHWDKRTEVASVTSPSPQSK